MVTARKAERAKQALVHIRLAVQAMEDMDGAIVDDLRAIYQRIQAFGKGD